MLEYVRFVGVFFLSYYFDVWHLLGALYVNMSQEFFCQQLQSVGRVNKKSTMNKNG